MGFMMPDLGYLKYEIKERWERLAIREWLSRSPKLVIGASVVLVDGNGLAGAPSWLLA